MRFRITADVGGTFTDVAVTDERGGLTVGKAPTTPDEPFAGTQAAIAVAANAVGTDVSTLLSDTDVFVYSTTRATNAILERRTAPTAFLVTEGFPELLRVRESGKSNPFDFDLPYPDPYIPEYFTFEVPERVLAEGAVSRELDEDDVRGVLASLPERGVEAVAVCLLWSLVNPAHELRVGELVRECCPGVSVTLSHELIPVAGEQRRASATAIDASLKPVMSAHLTGVGTALREAGFTGELFGATIFGGVLPIEDLARRPIYSAGSGPALAPVGGHAYGDSELDASNVIVCDMGGTSFDVSLVRDGALSYAKETWLGSRKTGGYIVATPSVDVRSIGAGGGSIAWIDSGGLLRVGPGSAGSEPGPACYGRGGQEPTVTDAAMVLRYLQPDMFLGGRKELDPAAAERVVGILGTRLGLGLEEAADAILRVATEQMVGMIREITVSEGIDPRESLVVAGGGASGLTISRIVAELGCSQVLVPRTSGVLSAVGGQHSDVIAEFKQTFVTRTDAFDATGVEATLLELDRQAREFADRLPATAVGGVRLERSVTAKYPSQVWDIELSLPEQWANIFDPNQLAEQFHADYKRAYAVSDPNQEVEFLGWRVRLVADVGTPLDQAPAPTAGQTGPHRRSQAYFSAAGWVDVPIFDLDDLPDDPVGGPAVVAADTATVVVYPGDMLRRTRNGHCVLEVTQ